MPGTVLNLHDFIAGIGGEDKLASAIASKHQDWMTFRARWMEERKEIRNYLFATDTTTTTNNALPWKNSTTIPKLTQIRDNLHANYLEALFPNENWLAWEGDDRQGELADKRRAIEAYMRTKLRQDRAELQLSALVLDYIDYGNCFATAKWVDESTVDPLSGETVRGYVGPRIVRISPYDITFDLTGSRFENAPKIIRSVKTIGEIAKMVKELEENNPNDERLPMLKGALDRSLLVRKTISQLDRSDTLKDDGYRMDGFASMRNYFDSDYVEILTFFGDMYDVEGEELLENHVISVIDGLFVLDKRPNDDWTTHPGIFHSGWRQRPDNLYAMGPLDNLVGMQYRIDHLENLKADVFDLIAYPVQKIRGYVEDYEYGPGERIIVGEDGDVEFMSPDTTALNAELQIDRLEARMEELAGAPREALGIRSPGEKTAFEVQTLDNASQRLFNSKVVQFERQFLEPLLNYMLQLARRHMSSTDVTRTLDSEIDSIVFQEVTREDIVANGLLRPRGARHFAKRARILQNLVQLFNSAVAQDPQVMVHLSGKKIAQLLEEALDLERFDLFSENVRIEEQAETQSTQDTAAENTQILDQTPAGILEADPENEQTSQLLS